ncbi:Uncharacterised protein [uncultured archaeon]|nr:Uncharacterised protein [uncultured archaeon]
MKDKRTILNLGLIAVLVLGLEGICLGADEEILIIGENGTTTVNGSALNSTIGQINLGSLNANEKEGLLYMAEEEKLAGDVYQTLRDKWNLQVFNNIGKAERTHEAAVILLINRYNLDDPTTKEVGKFNNVTLQKTYNELVLKGETSLKDALDVGAVIEEIDIIDLQKRIIQTDKEDIRLVYENLMKGSGNHLRAFVLNLNRQGYEYTPLYLSKDEYNGIINGNN